MMELLVKLKKWWQGEGYPKDEKEKIDPNMKYLIVGLGNIGEKYNDTRHNIGFEVVDVLASRKGAKWEIGKQAMYAEIKVRGRYVTLIKPTTYMNLSGNAVSHWMNKLKLKRDNLLIVVDDLHIDLGVLRVRRKGSDGGHNGLKDIARVMGGSNYNRLKVGIGKDFYPGQQVEYVLGKWKSSELKQLPEIIDKAADACESFVSIGMQFTMEKFNK